MSKFETPLGTLLWRGGIVTAATGAVLTYGGLQIAHNMGHSQEICTYQNDGTPQCYVQPPDPQVAHNAEIVGLTGPALIGYGIVSMLWAGYADRRRSITLTVSNESVDVKGLDTMSPEQIFSQLPEPRRESI